jgi:hypothetical protein
MGGADKGASIVCVTSKVFDMGDGPAAPRVWHLIMHRIRKSGSLVHPSPKKKTSELLGRRIRLKRIFMKLGACTRTEAVCRAGSMGLLARTLVPKRS